VGELRVEGVEGFGASACMGWYSGFLERKRCVLGKRCEYLVSEPRVGCGEPEV
jgi:hypothetical protein